MFRRCAIGYLDVILDRSEGFARVERSHLDDECCFLKFRMTALARDGALVKRMIAKDEIDPWSDPQSPSSITRSRSSR